MAKYKCSYCGKEAVAFYITPDKKVVYLCEKHAEEFIFKGIAVYLPYLKELDKYKGHIKGVAKKENQKECEKKSQNSLCSSQSA